jgi:SAM-dependent methyltransferase
MPLLYNRNNMNTSYVKAFDDPELNRICSEWEQTYRYGTPEDRKQRAAKWEPYYSYAYKKYQVTDSGIVFPKEGAIADLSRAGVLEKDSSMLDIGCGTGGHTLAASQCCSHVDAIDCNEAAIEILRQRIAVNHIDNVRADCISWEDYNPDTKYDTVFSSMCPAICNIDELMRMESISSKYCVLVTVMKGSYDKYRKMLLQELDIQPEGMITEGSVYLDVLGQLGREAQVFNYEEHYEYQTSLDELIGQYVSYLEIFGLSRSEAESQLRRFFERNQKNGVLYDETHMKTAMLVWRTGV